MKSVVLRTFQKLDQAEDGADKLRDNGRKGSAPHTHMESSYKQKIQNHVYHGRNNQVNQRVCAVSHGLQNAYEDIVKYKCNGATEINAEIGSGIWKHIFRCPHPYQQNGSEQKADYSEQYACYQSECYRGVDGLLYLIDLSGPIVSGNDDACADGNAVEKAYHQENEASGGADGRQGLASQKISNDQGIRRIIKLLEQIPEKKRDGKGGKFSGNGPFGHECRLTFHNFLFSCRTGGNVIPTFYYNTEMGNANPFA